MVCEMDALNSADAGTKRAFSTALLFVSRTGRLRRVPYLDWLDFETYWSPGTE